MLNYNSTKPLFVQISEWVEKEIMDGKLKPGDRVYSQNELATFFSVNAITAAKGIDILERNGVLVKRRGIGMFVKDDALDKINSLSKTEGLIDIINDMWIEARKLGLSKAELYDLIESKKTDEVN